MSILEGLKDMFNPHPEDRKRPLDFDEDGRVLFKDDVISKISEEPEKRRRIAKAAEAWRKGGGDEQ